MPEINKIREVKGTLMQPPHSVFFRMVPGVSGPVLEMNFSDDWKTDKNFGPFLSAVVQSIRRYANSKKIDMQVLAKRLSNEHPVAARVENNTHGTNW